MCLAMLDEKVMRLVYLYHELNFLRCDSFLIYSTYCAFTGCPRALPWMDFLFFGAVSPSKAKQVRSVPSGHEDLVIS